MSKPGRKKPTVTHHAQLRWDERFSDRDILREFRRARFPTASTLSLLQKSHRELQDQDYLITDDGIVFVMSRKNAIITILQHGRPDYADTVGTKSQPLWTRDAALRKRNRISYDRDGKRGSKRRHKPQLGE